MNDEKKPRLFYFEEAVEAYVPCPDAVEHVVSIENFVNHEEILINFKRFDMTDKEYENLPEG